MRIKMLLIAACAALVASGLAGAHNGTYVTKVTIKGPGGDFYGKVISSSKTCMANRKVTVWKQKGSVQNRSVDKKIASDTSELRGLYGEWSVGNTGYKHGKFYARAAKSPGCQAAASKTIKI